MTTKAKKPTYPVDESWSCFQDRHGACAGVVVMALSHKTFDCKCRCSHALKRTRERAREQAR